jgi:hypothetical protein
MKGFLNKLQNNVNHKKNKMRGGGVSLGGTKPGTIIPISIPAPGPIGAGIENTKDGTAIVSLVSAGSQAEKVGLQRGDAVCFSDSNGGEEIPYRLFLNMVKSDARPLVFDVRRVDSNSNSSAAGPRTKMRADDEARRRAVIAAAEARDKQNKQKKKPIRKFTDLSAADKKRMEERKEQLAIHNETYMADAPLSDEARVAVEAAKTDEAAHAQQLGYNPYEMMKGTGQQASNTVTNITHGSIDAGASAGAGATSSGAGGATRPSTRTSANQDAKGERKQETSININPTFDDAFTSLVTTNTSEEQVKKSLRIMRKLISNATTAKDADDAKRKVRISNPNKHIQAAVNDMNGALDLMFAVGFMMSESEDAVDEARGDPETCLVFPPGDIPAWLPSALERMEQYESGL